MTTPTTNFGLKKGDDADNSEVYLHTDLATTLDSIDTLLRTVTGGFVAIGADDGAANYGLQIRNNSQTQNNLLVRNDGRCILGQGARMTVGPGAGVVIIPALPAFVAGDKYVVVDASGNLHISGLGPAS